MKKITAAYINNTKVSQELRSMKNLKTGHIYRTDVAGPKKRIWTEYLITENLSYFDISVADAIYTLWLNGYEKFSAGQVLRVLSGEENQTLTEKKKQAILDSIHKMMQTTFKMDCSYEVNAKHFVDGEYEKTYNRAFLPCEKVPGSKTQYYLTEKMPLYEYAEMNGQIVRFGMDMMRTKKGSNSIETILIKRYLIHRIMVLKNGKGTFQNKKIVYITRSHKKGSAKYAGMLPTLDLVTEVYDSNYSSYEFERKRKRIHSTVCTILDEYKERGIIEDFFEVKHGEKANGVSLVVTAKNKKNETKKIKRVRK